MASLATTTAVPSCLGCVARRTGGWASAAWVRPTRPTTLLMPTTTTTTTTAMMQQTRGKKTRRREPGVLVRLLEDVPRFGRRDTLLRVERGRMRNSWYPSRLAEYATAARLAELGLTAADAAAPDPFFLGGAATETAEAAETTADDPLRPRLLRPVDAARAAALLEARVPPTLVFYRRAIEDDAGRAIFGSVSADDVAAAVREALRGDAGGEADADVAIASTEVEADAADAEAVAVRIEGRDVRFLVADAPDAPAGAPPADADRVKTLGRWEVEIAVRGSLGGSVAPVRKTVDVREGQ